AAPEIDQPRGRLQAREECPLLLGEVVSVGGELAGALEISAVGRDERKREDVRRVLPVIASVERAQLAPPLCVVAGGGPAAGAKLDHGEVPRGVSHGTLVAVAQLAVVALE